MSLHNSYSLNELKISHKPLAKISSRFGETYGTVRLGKITVKILSKFSSLKMQSEPRVKLFDLIETFRKSL